MEEKIINGVVKRRDSKRAYINSQIRVSNVRLIDSDGEQLGVVPTRDAMQKAQDAGLDLVEISPNAEPPVCRIMDYGKFLFDQKKKAHDARKKQKRVSLKEIKFRVTTDEGDYQVKLRNLIRFLEGGDKTKVTIRFRGREMAHQDMGLQVMERVKTDLLEYGVVEQEAKREGRQMVMVLAPKKKK